jgi:hypothetical protein
LKNQLTIKVHAKVLGSTTDEATKTKQAYKKRK